MNKIFKVLVVDDLAKNLQVVGNVLKSDDIQTIFALNGHTAIISAQKNKPDLILLDISMPAMDGYEVAQTLKSDSNTKDIPIIFLTARNQNDEIVKGFELGAVDYITKPFYADELIKRVRLHLELKDSQDTIKNQYHELELANEMKDKMLALIAHDLRGPVGNFKTLIELLINGERDKDEAMKNQILDLLQQNAAQTFNLLENLLNWSRSQRGSLTVVPENFNIANIIIQVIDLLKPISDSKGIVIQNLSTLDIDVYADKEMISTILRNLISNAIKFTHTNGEITIFAHIGKNEMVEVFIADNGVGIAPDVAKNLFNTPNIISTRGTENEKGSGIGLILCKEFIEKNGGSINVESEINKGSIFTISIPIYKKQL